MKAIIQILNVLSFVLVINYLTYVANNINPDQFKYKVSEVSGGLRKIYGRGFKDNHGYNLHKIEALTVYSVKKFSIETVGVVVKLIAFNKEYLTNINKIIRKNIILTKSIIK